MVARSPREHAMHASNPLATKPAFSSFSVDDIQKERRFFQDVLGLDVKDGEMGTLELSFGKGAAKVLVYPKPDHQPATFTVLNFAVDDVDATVERLASRGVRF